MTYEVLVKQKDSRYVAVALGVPGVSAEATTRLGAIQQVSDALEAYLADSEIVMVDVATHIAVPERKPISHFIGMWSHDEQFEQFLKKVDLHRDAVDADSSQP